MGFTVINKAGAVSSLRSSLLSQSNSSKGLKLQQSTPGKCTTMMSRQLPRKGKADVNPHIARDLAVRTRSASLSGPDDIVLQTEDIMDELHQELEDAQDSVIRGILAIRSLELMRLWNSCAPPEQNVGKEINPGSGASALQNATYPSSLLLALRHPPLLAGFRK